MNIDTLKDKILYNQEWLLKTSVKVKNSIDGEIRHNDILNWIKSILRNDPEILQAFDIQIDSNIRNAVLTLLGTNSTFKEALLRPLIYRIISYLSSTLDLVSHSHKNSTLEEINVNFKLLIDLTKEYKSTLEHVSIEKIAKSLSVTGLKEYIAHFKETDIQIVLKCLKWDEDKKEQHEEMTQLLDFLFKRLIDNTRRRGIIGDSRHAWWAFKDNLILRGDDWVLANQSKMEIVIRSLLNNGIYFAQSQMGKSILDTSSSFYERVWVLENAITIYEFLSRSKTLIPDFDRNELKMFILNRVREHTRLEYVPTLRNVQCDLILLYDILDHFPLLYSEQIVGRSDMIKKNNLTISERQKDITWKEVLNIIKN
jgi:hypothetical protein